MATTQNLVQFSANLDIANDVLIFTDLTSGRDSACKGVVKVTHMTTGVVLFQSSDWAETDPTAWASPDIDGSTATWDIDDIPLPSGDYNGVYKVEYKFYDPDSVVVNYTFTVTRTFTIAYTAPVVVIDLSASCSTSLLTSTDATEYMITHNGEDYDPTSKVISHTVTKPAGSGANAPGTTAAVTRTIGGGSTEATRLWTKIWQTDISTALTYKIAEWGATDCDLYITDTVAGSDYIDVQCDTTVCNLAQCYYNLFDRWQASLTTNFAFKDDYRDKVIQAQGLFAKLQWQERCGESTEQTILDLKTLLAGYDCTCQATTDAASVPIVPWAAIAGTGSSASTFVFHVETGAPTALDGNNGDIWCDIATYNLYQKASGAWTLKGNIQGATGTDATADVKVKVLVSTADPTYATGANTDATDVCYPFEVLNNDLFVWAGDFLVFLWEVQLGATDNGKTLVIKYDDTNVFTWFTDDEVIAGVNDMVTVGMKVTRVNNIYQHLTTWLTRAGQTYGPYITRDHNCDLTTDKTVSLRGTNSVASAGDIVGLSTVIKSYHREVEIIPGGGTATDGRGLVSQQFVATEGQTTFVVTDFTANSYYIPIIDGNIQSQAVVTRVGNTFTYSPGLSEGQVLLIVN